mmetsp:Transcript_114421/g.323463  ORF Transcript_114421/g.323463 Transcript_114421/m.323463 type:complete len:380 (+) Transcript_114421:31-1170(+)
METFTSFAGPEAVWREALVQAGLFPSGRYSAEIQHGEAGVARIFGPGLLWEYLKLNFSERGHAWRTVLTVLLDQSRSVYLFWSFHAYRYLIDVVFNVQDHGNSARLVLPADRMGSAVVVSCVYIGVPFVLLHLWDRVKVRMDLLGRSRFVLVRALIWRYSRYTEDSRSKVLYSELQHQILTNASKVANGYIGILALLQVGGELAAIAMFVTMDNPRALWLFAVLLVLLGLFCAISCRTSPAYNAMARNAVAKEKEVLGLVRDLSYRRAVDMEGLFQKAAEWRSAQLPQEVVSASYRTYCSAWLDPVVVGIYCASESHAVIAGSVSVSNFSATLIGLKLMSMRFTEVPRLLLDVTETVAPLRQLTVYLNLPVETAPFEQE